VKDDNAVGVNGGGEQKQRVPFFAGKDTVVKTSDGESRYHLSGYTDHVVKDNTLELEGVSLIGHYLKGADLGTLRIGLPNKAQVPLTKQGDFKTSLRGVYSDGSNEGVSVDLEVSGRVEGHAFREMCLTVSSPAGISSVAGGRSDLLVGVM